MSMDILQKATQKLHHLSLLLSLHDLLKEIMSKKNLNQFQGSTRIFHLKGLISRC